MCRVDSKSGFSKNKTFSTSQKNCKIHDIYFASFVARLQCPFTDKYMIFRFDAIPDLPEKSAKQKLLHSLSASTDSDPNW